MIRKLLFLLLLVSMLASCAKPPEKLKISATTWVGYSPLFYAKAKGWLDPLNIKLLHVVSLSENMYLYQSGNADAYVGTQYEYNVMHTQKIDLRPVMMFDRSNGGDLILSNRSLEELKATKQVINVYLEMDSINRILIEDFMKKYGFSKDQLNFINKDQAGIAALNFKNNQKPTVIVTYTPYDLKLEKKGFKEILSTRDGLDLLVVDALFTTKPILAAHRKQFEQLKVLVARAIDVLNKNPEEFYKTVKPYLLELSYHDFKESLQDIQWVNDALSPELSKRLNDSGFSTEALLP